MDPPRSWGTTLVSREVPGLDRARTGAVLPALSSLAVSVQVSWSCVRWPGLGCLDLGSGIWASRPPCTVLAEIVVLLSAPPPTLGTPPPRHPPPLRAYLSPWLSLASLLGLLCRCSSLKPLLGRCPFSLPLPTLFPRCVWRGFSGRQPHVVTACRLWDPVISTRHASLPGQLRLWPWWPLCSPGWGWSPWGSRREEEEE